MATPVFKFNYPNHREDLYFIFNTVTGFPETIPMDLLTFIKYHRAIDRPLDGFIALFNEIQQAGTSPEDSTFEDYFKNKWLNYLFQNVVHSDCLDVAYKNEDSSLYLKKGLLNNHHFDIYSFIEKLDMNDVKMRTLDYYHAAGNYQSEWFNMWSARQIEKKNKFILDWNESELVHAYESGEIDIHLIPLKYRNYGYFYNEFLSLQIEYLIPFYGNEKRRIEVSKIALLEEVKINPNALEHCEDILKNDEELQEAILKNIKANNITTDILSTQRQITHLVFENCSPKETTNKMINWLNETQEKEILHLSINIVNCLPTSSKKNTEIFDEMMRLIEHTIINWSNKYSRFQSITLVADTKTFKQSIELGKTVVSENSDELPF